MSTDSLMLFSWLNPLPLTCWNLHLAFDQWNKTEVTVIDFGDHVMKKYLGFHYGLRFSLFLSLLLSLSVTCTRRN